VTALVVPRLTWGRPLSSNSRTSSIHRWFLFPQWSQAEVLLSPQWCFLPKAQLWISFFSDNSPDATLLSLRFRFKTGAVMLQLSSRCVRCPHIKPEGLQNWLWESLYVCLSVAGGPRSQIAKLLRTNHTHTHTRTHAHTRALLKCPARGLLWPIAEQQIATVCSNVLCAQRLCCIDSVLPV
jgi:hypothetical protein